MPRRKIEQWLCTCLRCSYEWVPHLSNPDPTYCASCKSPDWDKPRQYHRVPVAQGIKEEKL